MKIAAVLAFALLAVVADSQQINNNYKKVCYFANWAYYRNGLGQYWVTKLDPFECTHYIYGFAVLDEMRWEMKVYDSWIDLDNDGYEIFTNMKLRNPALKTLIALGGWNDSHFTAKYSEMVADPAKMAHFVESVVNFVRRYNFDGLDFDWEYPGDPGAPEDKENFITLLRMLRDALQPYGLMLTMAPSCSIERAEVSYNIPALAEVVDFVNFMAYDIHGSWENSVDHHAPLYRRSWDADNAVIISEGVDYWLDRGMPAEKIIFGLPSYGRSFRLANTSQTDVQSPAIGPGPAGPFTMEDGFVSLYEVCQYVQNGWAVVNNHPEVMGPYTYSGVSWVGWDDIPMIITKVKYAMEKGLGGIMFWEITLDDFNGFCGLGLRPLSKAITDTLNGAPPRSTTTTNAPPPTGVRCNSEGQYFADPADCNKYYMCISGFVETLRCPGNYVFNTANNNCVPPGTVAGC